jgi:hypothetical protein
MSEERVLAACPDVHDCTVVSAEVGGRIVTDVLLALHNAAYPGLDLDRTAAVRDALTGTAAARPRSVRVIPEGDLVSGPTNKVRTFLMRQRQRAQTARV